MTDVVLDFADARPGADAIKGVGAVGVVRYICDEASERSFPGKLITASELSEYVTAGLAVGFVFEQEANRPLKGAAVGRADAVFARSYARGLGVPDTVPIFLACDFAANPADVLPYYAGVMTGDPRAGVYGRYAVLMALPASMPKWLCSAWAAPEIRDFQREQGLTVDGALGPITFGRLSPLHPEIVMFQDGNHPAPLEGTDWNQLVDPSVLWDGSASSHRPSEQVREDDVRFRLIQSDKPGAGISILGLYRRPIPTIEEVNSYIALAFPDGPEIIPDAQYQSFMVEPGAPEITGTLDVSGILTVGK